ncbi:MAG: hypothetical protein ABII01_02280 [Candidatus Woesearchaeota archaeon]
MKKRAVFYLFIGILMVLLINPFVFARSGSVFEPLDDLFMDVIPNKDLSSPTVRDNPSLWIFITFTIVYGIIYAATARVTILKEEKGARVMMSIAFAIMSVIVPGLMRLLAGLSPIFLMIVIPVILFFIVKTAWSDFGAGATEASTRSAETKLAYQKADNAYQKELKEMDKEQKQIMAEDSALSNLKKMDGKISRAIGDEIGLMKDIRARLQKVKDALQNSRSDVAQEEAKRIYNELASVLRDVSNIAQMEAQRQAVIGKIKALDLEEYKFTNDAMKRDTFEATLIRKVIQNEKGSGARAMTGFDGATGNAKRKKQLLQQRLRQEERIELAGYQEKSYLGILMAVVKRKMVELEKMEEHAIKFQEAEQRANQGIATIRNALQSGNLASVNIGVVDGVIKYLEEQQRINNEISRVDVVKLEQELSDTKKYIRKIIKADMKKINRMNDTKVKAELASASP